MDAEQLLEMIQEELEPEYTIQSAIAFLEDGRALTECGVTHDDQEAVEELHAQLLEEQEEYERSVNEWAFDALARSEAKAENNRSLGDLAQDVENYAYFYFAGNYRHLREKKVAALLLAYHAEAIDFDDAIERLKA